MSTMKIGELSEKAGVTARTIRYYEEIDLIRPFTHSQKGYRLYSENTLARLSFIRDLKELDFSLEEIKILIQNMDGCQTGRELAEIMTPILRINRKKTSEKIHTYQKVREDMLDYYQLLKND